MREYRELRAAPSEKAFASIGPKGHRARMRHKLLAHGPGAFAEYELLEMLLFLGIERRDTKPLAKATINRFGSLAQTLVAPPEALSHLGHRSVIALKLVHEAASRLSRAEQVARAHLSDWDRLVAYLDEHPVRHDDTRALLLNNRNRLLADVVIRSGPVPDQARAVAAGALDVHATAVILVCPGEGTRDEPAALARAMRKAAALLSVQLHDCVVGRPGQWRSLRGSGLLQ